MPMKLAVLIVFITGGGGIDRVWKSSDYHEVPTEFQDEDIIYVVYRKATTPVA